MLYVSSITQVTLLVRLHLELTGKQLQVEVEPDRRKAASGEDDMCLDMSRTLFWIHA